MPELTEKIRIFDFNWEGQGIGRAPDGKIVMIFGAVPGDEVSVKLEDKGRYYHGFIDKIIKPSPDRTGHFCSYYNDFCPGCPLGAFDYKKGLEWKKKHLRETLKRIGGLEEPDISDVIPSPKNLAYRDRIELNLIKIDTGFRLAYHTQNGYLPILHCSLAEDIVSETLSRSASYLNRLDAAELINSAHINELENAVIARILLKDNGIGGAVITAFLKDLEYSDIIKEMMKEVEPAGWQIRKVNDWDTRFFKSKITAFTGDIKIQYQIYESMYISAEPVVFSQANAENAEILADKVVELLPVEGGFIDFYGGYGLFGFRYALKKRGRALVVESSEDAISAGRELAFKENLPVKFRRMNLNKIPRNFTIRDKYNQAAVVDPPRSGVSTELLKFLNQEGLDTIIYVSCHPAALARDLKILKSYHPVRFTPIDMFPYTPNLETICLLLRKS
ncbi:class I SAM-dependent RNA methyltransferase [bacterium]|nr:class I SAM-dependent RNA methyltransferase [bacterium]